MKEKLITYFIAAVWLVNGLFCKVLNFVPRHEAIVGRILGTAYAPILIKLIGAAEIVMCIWVVSGFRKRLNVWTQIIVIAMMNILEFFLASDLLFWGQLNAFFAFLLIILIYYHEFKSAPFRR